MNAMLQRTQVRRSMHHMKVNPVGKNASEAEWAYIAGFLDADGAIIASIEHHKEKRHGFRVRVVIKATQSQREILDWIREFTCVGLVRKNRTTFDWIVRDKKHTNELLLKLLPHLKVKKKQAELAVQILVLPELSQNDFLLKAQTADALSRFNVRSKNRRKNYVTVVQDSFSRND